MARSVRVIDESGYPGGVIRPDVEVMEFDGRIPYRRRWSGREPLVMILVLVLIAIWVYRNSAGEAFGRQLGEWIPSTRNSAPVEVETAPVDPPLAPVEYSPTPPVEELPTAPVERAPAITVEQQSDILGYARVASERLNLREQPGFERRVIAILPRNWEVAILRQSHQTPNGDVWVEVFTETDYGRRKGWVMWRYLDTE